MFNDFDGATQKIFELDELNCSISRHALRTFCMFFNEKR